MQLKTEYRDQTTGVLKGTKQFFLVCTVAFTEEERAVIQERGMYDQFVAVPSDTPPPTRGGDFLSMLMRIAAVVLVPLGLLFSCTQYLRPAATAGAGPWPSLMLFGGIALFVVGKMRDRQANKRADDPNQELTLRRLLTNPTFVVYAPNLVYAKDHEEEVKAAFKNVADVLRANVVVPETNTYDL